MNIVRYNKKIQERLNLNINDYKEYSQLYSSIEIELKITDNKHLKFINPLTSPGEGVTIFTSPYLSAGAPTLGEAKGLSNL